MIDVAIGFGKFILENQINTYTADEDSETFLIGMEIVLVVLNCSISTPNNWTPKIKS